MIAEHGEAFDYDLMTRLGVRLVDVPETIGWHAAYVFSRHLPLDSALFQSKYPEYAAFGSPIQQSALMADIIDLLQWFKFDFDSAHTKDSNTLQKPKRFPTPWEKERQRSEMSTIGKGAIPISQFDAWYYGED